MIDHLTTFFGLWEIITIVFVLARQTFIASMNMPVVYKNTWLEYYLLNHQDVLFYNHWVPGLEEKWKQLLRSSELASGVRRQTAGSTV